MNNGKYDCLDLQENKMSEYSESRRREQELRLQLHKVNAELEQFKEAGQTLEQAENAAWSRSVNLAKQERDRQATETSRQTMQRHADRRQEILTNRDHRQDPSDGASVGLALEKERLERLAEQVESKLSQMDAVQETVGVLLKSEATRQEREIERADLPWYRKIFS